MGVNVSDHNRLQKGQVRLIWAKFKQASASCSKACLGCDSLKALHLRRGEAQNCTTLRLRLAFNNYDNDVSQNRLHCYSAKTFENYTKQLLVFSDLLLLDVIQKRILTKLNNKKIIQPAPTSNKGMLISVMILMRKNNTKERN